MHEMEETENTLRSALRRKPAPGGFAARVLSRVESDAGPRARVPVRRRSRGRVWALAAALAMIAAGLGVIELDRRVERRRNRAALEQTLAALAIAATQLERAQEKAFSSSGWERAAERLSRLSAPATAPRPAATHSNAGGSRI
jgi:hypothetical protein